MAVRVEVETLACGMAVPKVVIWNDGGCFEVSRVIYYSNSKSGEYEGIRYTVIIGSAEKIYLPSQSQMVCDGFGRR